MKTTQVCLLNLKQMCFECSIKRTLGNECHRVSLIKLSIYFPFKKKNIEDFRESDLRIIYPRFLFKVLKTTS